MIVNCARALACLSGLLIAEFCAAATSLDSTGDPLFGTDLGAGGGQVRIAFDQGGSNDDQPLALLRTSGGKYLLVSAVTMSATFQTEIGLVRLNPDGSTDTSFGTAGKVVSNVLNSPTAATMDTQGRIVVVGSKTSFNDFGVARFLPNGSLDLSFAGTGSTSVHPTYGGYPTAVGVDPAGLVVVGGNVNTGQQNSQDIHFMWFTDTGSLDGQSGAFSNCYEDVGGQFIHSAYVSSLAIDRNGTLVAAGSCLRRAAVFGPTCTAFPTTLNGGPDGAGNQALAIVFDASGRALVTGSELVGTSGATRSFVTRLGTDGSVDASFGGTQPGAVPGETYLNLPGTTTAGFAAVAARSDGSIVEVGSADGSLLVARLNNDGSQDFNFNAGQSYRIFPFSAGASRGQRVIIDSGRPVIAGSVNGGTPGGQDLAILRLQSDLIFKDRFEPPL